MKFAHIADTHIRNLKYHEEYNVVFSKMYEILKKEKVDYIVHCGDIAHTKTQIAIANTHTLTRKTHATVTESYICI